MSRDKKKSSQQAPHSPLIEGSLLKGRRGLIMGVANNHSIAWGIARVLASHGAELAFSYQNEGLLKRVQPLVDSVKSTLLIACDAGVSEDVEALFEKVEEEWGSIDFVVHAVAYSDKNGLRGPYVDTTRDNFLKTLDISCYSFTHVARCASRLMCSPYKNEEGGALLTLTYDGANRVMPNYNVMGVAKAALEASVRYLASDLGVYGIRVNAISAGPVRTLAGSAIADARLLLKWARHNAPLRKLATTQDIGLSALYLLSDLAGCVSGEVHYVDSGFNIVGIPKIEELLAEVMS